MAFQDFKYRFMDIGRSLGRPHILFWALPWLMILIVIGTIDQKFIGLYDAHHKYFAAFIWWFYGIPLPAGYAILSLITLNLVCKFVFLSPWTRDKAGINLIHFSIILLMVGGLVTAVNMKEGYIALSEGQSDHIIRDYHDRVLILTKDEETIVIPFDDIRDANLPLDVEIVNVCRHSAIRPRVQDETNDGVGAASMAELACVPPTNDNERNVAGMTYRILDGDDKGLYIVFEGRQTTDTVNGYDIRIDRAQRDLPFTILLQSFRRDVYPGTNQPREYESRVTVIDGDVRWPAVISMNEPLRYGGYTFYQASTLIDRDGQAISVLSVVKNAGWIFPYVSGILLALGLILHMVIRTRGRAS